MKQFQKSSLLIFSLIANLYITFIYSWLYEVHTYSDNYEQIGKQQSEIEHFEDFYDYVEKPIYLEDGRVLQCKIPLHESTFPMDEEERSELQKQIEMQNKGKKIILDENQISQFLSHLEGTCVYHFKFDFLYEYCFNKYVKQFDDQTTIRNAQKKEAELIYLGFHQNYNNSTNTTNLLAKNNNIQQNNLNERDENLNQQQPFQYYLPKPEMSLPQFNLLNQINKVYVEKNLVYFANAQSRLSVGLDIEIIVQKQQKQIENYEQIVYKATIINILDNIVVLDKFITNQEGFYTENFQIIQEKENKNNKLQKEFIKSKFNFVNQNLIYSKKLHGFSHLQDNDLILLVNEEQDIFKDQEEILYMTRIKKVWSENVIQIEQLQPQKNQQIDEQSYIFENVILVEEFQNQNKIQEQRIIINNNTKNTENVHSAKENNTDQQFQWVILEQDTVVISNNLIINVPDIFAKLNPISIKLVQTDTKNSGNSIEFIVKDIFHNIVKLQGPNGNFEGYYIAQIRKDSLKNYPELNYLDNVFNNNKINQKQEEKQLNLQDKNDKQEQFNHRKMYGLPCLTISNNHEIYHDREFIDTGIFNATQYDGNFIMTFKIQKIKFQDVSSLRILLTDSLEDNKGLEIMFPFNNDIIVRETQNSERVTYKDPFFQNSTKSIFEQEKIWIVVQNNPVKKIRIGFSDKISATTQFLAHEIYPTADSNILNFIRVNIKKSYNLKLISLNVQPLFEKEDKDEYYYQNQQQQQQNKYGDANEDLMNSSFLDYEQQIQKNISYPQILKNIDNHKVFYRNSNQEKNSYQQQKQIQDEIQQEKSNIQEEEVQLLEDEKKPISENQNIQKSKITYYENSKFIYKQKFLMGEFCGATKKHRVANIEFSCGNSLFSFDDVKEANICEYQIYVSSYLMCNPKNSAYQQANNNNKTANIVNNKKLQTMKTSSDKIHHIQCIPFNTKKI